MKKTNYEKYLAQVVSTLFNPFLMLTIVFFIGNLSYIQVFPEQSLTFFILAITLPLAFYIYEILKHKTHWLHFVSLERKSRDRVFLAAVYSLIFTIIILSYMQEYYWLRLSIILLIFVGAIFLVNKYIDKISMHAGVFGFAAIYFIDKIQSPENLFFFFSLTVLAFPIIFWARIKLHKHTILQLMLGTSLGVFIGFLAWLL